MNNSVDEIIDGMRQVAKGFVHFAEDMANFIVDTINKLPLDEINKSLNKRVTKKKFKKMLQSSGIQRNQINKIMTNFNPPYTLKKLNDLLNEYVDEEE